ncbi:ATP-binding protein [Aquimarina sediminis]|uniref:ATP-binding protein n=1 Tax=Aquimarina sediminis TaxID=2070536 RepID=UPI000CA08E3B|nr:ATP-binding protein [Aquimarina sediminis]
MDLKISSGKYKSIGQLEWKDIPDFSVITGVNGSGKTQLLELVDYYYDRGKYNQMNRLGILGQFPDIQINNISLSKGDVVLLRSQFGLSSTGLINFSGIQSTIQQLYQHGITRKNSNPQYDEIIQNFESKTGSKIRDISIEEFTKKLPVDFFMTSDTQFNGKLNFIFYTYHIKFLNEQLKGKKDLQIRSELGPPPWEVFKDIMERIGFPFSITTPEGLDLLSSFDLKLFSINKPAERIGFSDLSGGEKVLMSLIIWLYNSQEHNVLPKLILLDEPDAHLHPSMTKVFIEIIQDILVKKYKTKVIMTTHSPSTVALVPEGNLFEMRRESPRINSISDKSSTISLLTSNLITVTNRTKFILVEDVEDVSFYSRVVEILKSKEKLPDHASIIFIPASTREGKGKIGGGCTVVRDWTEKLQSSGLGNILFGLVDGDKGVTAQDGIYVLNRYSFENFLLDPLVVFGSLLENEVEPKIDGIQLGFGEQYKIGMLKSSDAQMIVDNIVMTIEDNNGVFNENDKKRIEINYLNGKKLMLPNWIIEKRGHDLMNIYRMKFGQKSISFKSLINSLRKTQIIPTDLYEKIVEIWES